MFNELVQDSEGLCCILLSNTIAKWQDVTGDPSDLPITVAQVLQIDFQYVSQWWHTTSFKLGFPLSENENPTSIFSDCGFF
jgi:hypothetical protein